MQLVFMLVQAPIGAAVQNMQVLPDGEDDHPGDPAISPPTLTERRSVLPTGSASP
jgi:hypothetical protein